MDSVAAVAVVLPESYYGEAEWRNAERAREYVREAASNGAEMVFFPEGYPGPATGPLDQPQLDYRPIDGLCEEAAEHGVWIAASDVEANPSMADTYFLTLKLISPDGEIVERYLRVQPDTPPLNAYLYDGKAHLLPGDEFVVGETPYGKLGLSICSELWVPEIPRVLMLEGAEMLFSPVHGFHSETQIDGEQLGETWRCVARTRAAENTYFVIVTENAFIETGEYSSTCGAFIATPEGVLAERTTPGILMAELDFDRLRYLRRRNYDEDILSVPDADTTKIAVRPGQLWERNPALFEALTQSSEYSFDYDYYERGLHAWVEEYDRIYDGHYSEIQEKRGTLTFEKGHEPQD